MDHTKTFADVAIVSLTILDISWDFYQENIVFEG